MSDGRNLEAHVFVCTNSRGDGKQSCAGSGSVELRERLKGICQTTRADWHGRVRVNASGCLGRCAEGIALVCYPQAEWHTKLKNDDASSAVVAEMLGRILD